LGRFGGVTEPDAALDLLPSFIYLPGPKEKCAVCILSEEPDGAMASLLHFLCSSKENEAGPKEKCTVYILSEEPDGAQALLTTSRIISPII